MGRNAQGWRGGRASGRAGLGAGWNLGNSAQSNCRCSENRPGELRWMGTSLPASGRSPLGIPDTESFTFPNSSSHLQGADPPPHCLGQEPCWGWELGQTGSEQGDLSGLRMDPRGRNRSPQPWSPASKQTPQPSCQDPGLTVSLPCLKPIHSSPGALAWNRRPPGSGSYHPTIFACAGPSSWDAFLLPFSVRQSLPACAQAQVP